MATRSTIAMVNPDGSVSGVYCHFDGNIRNGVGQCLFEHWTDREKVEALIDLGSISILGSEIGEKHDFIGHHSLPEAKEWCLAYHRDRGEHDAPDVMHADSWEEFVDLYGEEYNYLFSMDDRWHWNAAYYEIYNESEGTLHNILKTEECV